MKELVHSLPSLQGNKATLLARSAIDSLRIRATMVANLQSGELTIAASESVQPVSEKPVNSRYADHLALSKIAFYLREPLAYTCKLLKRNISFLNSVEKFRNQKQPAARIKKHVQQFAIPQRSQYEALLERDQRSRIVASFHFGDFVYGLHKLLSLQTAEIETRVLSQKISSAAYISNMAKAFGEKGADTKNQMLVNNTSICSLSVFLRKPGNCLVTFVDLPAEFGEKVEVDFMGRKAGFSRSSALLSLANKVPILPAICFRESGRHYVQLGKQIEPSILSAETKNEAVQRIVQQQVSFFEYFFLRHQEQWRYLNKLPDYFTE